VYSYFPFTLHLAIENNPIVAVHFLSHSSGAVETEMGGAVHPK